MVVDPRPGGEREAEIAQASYNSAVDRGWMARRPAIPQAGRRHIHLTQAT